MLYDMDFKGILQVLNGYTYLPLNYKKESGGYDFPNPFVDSLVGVMETDSGDIEILDLLNKSDAPPLETRSLEEPAPVQQPGAASSGFCIPVQGEALRHAGPADEWELSHPRRPCRLEPPKEAVQVCRLPISGLYLERRCGHSSTP